MATTTNYGWTTPDDTSLVKDGASAIRTLGSSVDTTVKNLNPETTLGDISYRSSTANTNTRLAIGTTGQVLTVNGGVPTWATSSSGGMTLLSTTTLSGATTTISSISGAYNSLFAVITGVTNATADGNFRLAPNGTTNITSMNGLINATTDTRIDAYLFFTLPGSSALRTNADNSWTVVIDNYASTTAYKPISTYGGYIESAGGDRAVMRTGYVKTNSAITSLVFSNDSGNLSTGTVLLYGVK